MGAGPSRMRSEPRRMGVLMDSLVLGSGGVAELVDASDLKSEGLGRPGSSPGTPIRPPLGAVSTGRSMKEPTGSEGYVDINWA